MERGFNDMVLGKTWESLSPWVGGGVCLPRRCSQSCWCPRTVGRSYSEPLDSEDLTLYGMCIINSIPPPPDTPPPPRFSPLICVTWPSRSFHSARTGSLALCPVTAPNTSPRCPEVGFPGSARSLLDSVSSPVVQRHRSHQQAPPVLRQTRRERGARCLRLPVLVPGPQDVCPTDGGP